MSLFLFVFTGVNTFAHLDMLISKIIAVKNFLLKCYSSLPYLEKEVDLLHFSYISRDPMHSGSRTHSKLNRA